MASNTPKTMSSRLLTMKFMQRATASPSSPTTPHSEDDPSPKRRKLAESPADRKPMVDASTVQAALEEEERKRQAAIAKQAAELGDTRWVLDLPAAHTRSGEPHKTPLNVIHIGSFAQIDATDNTVAPGGLIRRFNMKKGNKAQTKPTSESEPSSGSDDESPSSPGSAGRTSPRPSPVASRGRPLETSDGKRKRGMSESSGRRNAERIKAKGYSAKRRKKEVKLNNPPATGISANSFRPRAASAKGGGGGVR